MGLFDIFSKKTSIKENQVSRTLLSMPMFNNGETYNLNNVIEHLKSFWGLEVSYVNGDNSTATFYISGQMVALAYMPIPIPWIDIKSTAQYAYNWMTAEKDLEGHNGHAIVSLLSGKMETVERCRILSKLLCSILITSNSLGVHQGSQLLLIPKEEYLANLEDLKEGRIPVSLWVYIGLRKSDIGNSAFTYGLTNFQKQEMEIINSKLSLEELYDFLANITAYAIGSNVTFKSGETLGYTEDQQMKITSSKGQFVEGQTLKLEM